MNFLTVKFASYQKILLVSAFEVSKIATVLQAFSTHVQLQKAVACVINKQASTRLYKIEPFYLITPICV